MAVATDYNPGTSPVVDLWMAATLACITMGLTVDEALRGITVHAARALGLSDRGRLEPGLRGDMVLVRPAPGEPCTAASLVQHMGAPEVHSVIVGGNPVA